MKDSKTVLAFERVNGTTAHSYTTEIEIVFGKNPRGEKYQILNQINTSNSILDDFGKSFEDMKFGPLVMVSLILDLGYSLKF